MEAGNNLNSIMQADRMNCTRTILDMKKKKGFTWEQIAKEAGGSPVFVTSCCLGENSCTKECAEKICKLLDIQEQNIMDTLCKPAPCKGCIPWEQLMQDPLIYRLHEVNLVFGMTLKELIQEKFGDGIMSAIDFEMYVDKEENPKGDRVKITMSGKYLPYKKF